MDDTGVMEYIQTPAEKLDVPDASMDIVLSVYLFHELPEDIREQAAREMYRVLKPGGLAVFCDSVQLGDRPEWNDSMGNFGECCFLASACFLEVVCWAPQNHD